MATDPYWNSVVLAMHMDDAGLTDLKGHAVTPLNSASRSATQSVFGGYSLALDGVDSALTIGGDSDFDVADGDFTIDMWVYRTTGTWSPLLSCSSANINEGWTLQVTYENFLYFYAQDSTATPITEVTSNIPLSSGFHHVACVRKNGFVKLFVDGVNNDTSTTNLPTAYAPTASGGLAIGRDYYTDEEGQAHTEGYIDDLRFTIGIARWDTTFSVPTEAFGDEAVTFTISGTVLGPTGLPAAYDVHVLRQSDSALAGITTSDEITGAYFMEALDETEHYVVCFPPGEEQAKIFNNITPV